MKLYHGTLQENVEDILENGLIPQTTYKHSYSVDRFLTNGIFGFDNLKDAISFAKDNSSGWEIAVVEFESDGNNTFIDPEYDGEARFFKTDDLVKAILVYND